jgi:asparagine synthase (glutamine-hydrolysing)
MCGIAAFLDVAGSMDETVLRPTAGTLRHRGPNDSGLSLQRGNHAVVGLAQTRLSILDLSEAGQQPMVYGRNSPRRPVSPVPTV